MLIKVDYCITFELWGFQDALQRISREQNFPSGAHSQGLVGVMKCSYRPSV